MRATKTLLARNLPLVGDWPAFHLDTPGFLLALARRQGDIARFRLGPTPAFLLSHPDHVQRVLVDDAAKFRKGHLMQRARRLLGDGLLTSESELHRIQRRRIQPAFARAHLLAYGRAVPRLARRAAESWQDGGRVGVVSAMDRLALAIVVQALLGADIDGEAASIGRDLTVLGRWFPILSVPGAHALERIGVPPFRSAGQAANRIDHAVRAYIAAAAESDSSELLALLLGGDGDPMRAQLVRDEVMTLFLAGHDTTAAALTWTWYLLGTNPHVRHELEEELERVLGGRDPEPEDCAQLVFSGMVLDEVLRLYPPVGRIGRRPVEDYEVDGERIPAGAAVFLSPFVTQRDERWWPDPDRFDPRRWSPAASEGRPRYAAFPFGAGPRSCIGSHMARMMGVLVIATIASRFRLHPSSARLPRIRSILTLKPRGAMIMTAERRPRP